MNESKFSVIFNKLKLHHCIKCHLLRTHYQMFKIADYSRKDYYVNELSMPTALLSTRIYMKLQRVTKVEIKKIIQNSF